MWGPQPWGVRRLLTHIKGLPPDSAYLRKLAPWRQDHELLATAVDALHRIEYLYVSVNGGESPKPDRFPRPETPADTEADAAAAAMSSLEFAALLRREPNV